MKPIILACLTMCGALLPVFCPAQVNSGSNGCDGRFNPTTNIVINSPVTRPRQNTYLQPETVI